MTDAKLGRGICLIGQATATRLGFMSLDFATEMRPQRIVIVDIDGEQFCCPGWFENLDTDYVTVIRAEELRKDPQVLKSCVDGMKYVVGFKTFFSNAAFSLIFDAGAKSVLWLSHDGSPQHAWNAKIVLCPSRADRDACPHGHYCPWPVRREAIWSPTPINWPPRRFVHNAGHESPSDPGTREVLEAAQFLDGTDARLYVHSQRADAVEVFEVNAQVRVLPLIERDRHQLYRCADCYVQPSRRGGLSLSILEAAANRTPVIVSECDEWGDYPWRIPLEPKKNRRPGVQDEQSFVSVEQLGRLMRGMALGEVEKALPPEPPTWSEFQEFWRSKITVSE